MAWIILAAVAFLAFGNGANDNSKGVATLVGGRTISLNKGLIFAAVATFLGSAASVLLAGGLIAKFSGKGLVGPQLLASSGFLTCVGLAAAGTVLLATRIGMPISTTHSLVGGIVGVGLAADALHVSRIVSAFFIPLLIAPFLALALSAGLYLVFRRARLAMGVTRQTCVCIEREFVPVSLTADGTVMTGTTGLKLSDKTQASECFERYAGHVVGLDAQRVLDGSHMVSAAAISFARGLNDTPKMAALIIAAGGLGSGSALVGVGVAIAVGGLLAARRVAETVSYRITGMNDGQAFTANLVTAGLVIVASRFGVPVSTTHVSCGGLFGIGLVNRKAHWNVIGQVAMSWLLTLPVAAALGWIAWAVLGG